MCLRKMQVQGISYVRMKAARITFPGVEIVCMVYCWLKPTLIVALFSLRVVDL
jgi:hypothetical protein